MIIDRSFLIIHHKAKREFYHFHSLHKLQFAIFCTPQKKFLFIFFLLLFLGVRESDCGATISPFSRLALTYINIYIYIGMHPRRLNKSLRRSPGYWLSEEPIPDEGRSRSTIFKCIVQYSKRLSRYLTEYNSQRSERRPCPDSSFTSSPNSLLQICIIGTRLTSTRA